MAIVIEFYVPEKFRKKQSGKKNSAPAARDDHSLSRAGREVGMT